MRGVAIGAVRDESMLRMVTVDAVLSVVTGFFFQLFCWEGMADAAHSRELARQRYEPGSMGVFVA
jgi:hypothetical protein